MKKKFISTLQAKKDNQDQISMLTAYDAITAQCLEETKIDIILVGDSLGNYLWSLDLLGHLLNQYRHRYNNKVHSTGRILNNLLKLTDNVRDKFQYKTFLIPPLCMPDEYKCDNYIQAYRNYYIGEKKRFAKYTLVDTPDFMC